MPEPAPARWTFPPPEPGGMTPLRLRDLIVECFTAAQMEAFHRALARTAPVPTREEVRDRIGQVVRFTFTEVGASWAEPDLQGLRSVIALLSRKASLTGTPRETVDDHLGQMELALLALEKGP